MSSYEQTITTAARLYEVRRAVRDIRGKQYAEDMAIYKLTIQGYAKRERLDLLPATMELGKIAQAQGKTIAFMLFMAAFVELTEES